MQPDGTPASADSAELNPGKAARHRKAFLLAALDRYERPLTAYAMRLLAGDLDQARDVVQHAFLRLCQQPTAAVEHKLAAWLYTVCRNRVIDQQRSKSASVGSLDADYLDSRVDDPADRAEKLEFLRRLRVRMDELPAGQREVVDLWSHGFASHEIATILDKQPGNVRVTLHRAIKQLRSEPDIAIWLDDSQPGTGQPGDPLGSNGSSFNSSETMGPCESTFNGAALNGMPRRNIFVTRKQR